MRDDAYFTPDEDDLADEYWGGREFWAESDDDMDFNPYSGSTLWGDDDSFADTYLDF